MAFDKVRIRFRKDGDRRFLSHLDLMRAFERMLRRASLPFRSTEGFHPQPRVVFALSLPLGLAGLQEVVEIEWLEPVEPDNVLSRLAPRTPHDLQFLSARRIELKQTARPRRATYLMALPVEDMEPAAARCAALMAATEYWVDRERPRPRQVNIRPFFRNLRVSEGKLEMDIWVTPEGSARADELVRELKLNHVLDAGAVIERCLLEIEDETNVTEEADQPPRIGPAGRALLERPLRITEPSPQPATAHWGASPNGPIVE